MPRQKDDGLESIYYRKAVVGNKRMESPVLKRLKLTGDEMLSCKTVKNKATR